jgi:hypothetical protein
MTMAGAGYAVWTGQDGRVQREADVAICVHCQAVVLLQPKPNVGWCARCSGTVCATCQASGRCIPFERRLAQAEASDRFCRSVGIGGP